MQVAVSKVPSIPSVPNPATLALTQYELAIDAPAQASANASTHEQLGLALGRDYALQGLTPPIAHLYPQSPLQRGWLAARERGAVRAPKAVSSATQLWLALRTHAWARGRSFEDIQLTPNYLQQLDVAYCPITREPLNDQAGHRHARSIDRVRNDAGYAAGHLAVMSRQANRTKGDRDHAALQAMATSLVQGPINEAGGLTAAEWQRLATLTSFVTELPHEQAAQLPLLVLPPNRLRMFNPIQALQALVTRQLTKPGWSARLARLEALLPSDALRTDFNRFLLSLAPRVLDAAKLETAEQIRWALEDAWALPLVQKRWSRFAMQLSAAQAEALVMRAAAKRLSTTHVMAHTAPTAAEGWALKSGGYVAHAM
jgi:hypothetical protein